MSDRNGWATTLSRIAAGLFGLVFAITLPMTMFANAWGNVLFSVEQMTDIFAEELVNSGALQELAVEIMLEEVPRAGVGISAGILDFLGRQRMDEMLSALFPPEWAESQVRANIERAFAWLDDDRLLPDLFLDVQPVKDRLLAGGAEELAETIVSSWPTCGFEQVEILMSEGVPRGGLPTFLCQPPEPLRTTVAAVATDLVLRQVSNLPETVELRDPRSPAANPQQIEEFKRGLRRLRAFSHAGWLLPLSTLGLIVAVAVRSWDALLRWWGGPIMAAGFGMFLMLGVGEGIAESARNSYPVRAVFPGPFESIIQDIIDRLLDAVSGQMFFLGLVVTVIGLAMLLAGIYLGRRAATTSLSKRP